jgi:hypothetical protein
MLCCVVFPFYFPQLRVGCLVRILLVCLLMLGQNIVEVVRRQGVLFRIAQPLDDQNHAIRLDFDIR